MVGAFKQKMTFCTCMYVLYCTYDHHFGGSGPIHRDVLKIIKLFAQNLRRHFFVRERGITHCVLLMSLGFTNWPLLFEIARLHHDFLL